jgi:thioredoxin 1
MSMPSELIQSRDFPSVVLQSEKPVLVDFFASWCGPCKSLSPIIDELADEMGDSVRICKIDVDKNRDMANKYGIMSVPTIMLFRGGKPVKSMAGLRKKEELRGFLES